MFSYFLAICPNQMVEIRGFIVFGMISFFFTAVSAWGVIYFPSVGVVYGDIKFLYGGLDGPFLIFLAVFLLIALIRVVKVVSLRQGPLRPFNSGR